VTAGEQLGRDDPTMTFHSILYRHAHADLAIEPTEAPEFFHDLNIDQLVAGVTGKDEYELKPFFYHRLGDVDAIAYRQEVMKDLEDPGLLERIQAFAEKMQEIRSRLQGIEQTYYRLHKNGWLLEAAAIYCAAVRQLAAALTEVEPRSLGFREFRDYLSSYVASEPFAALMADTERIKSDLRSVTYAVVVRGLAVTVRKYQDEIDYSAEIEGTFSKFRRGDVKDYLIRYPEFTGMGHVDAQIVE
jgi:DNA mismatch repair protein MutS